MAESIFDFKNIIIGGTTQKTAADFIAKVLKNLKVDFIKTEKKIGDKDKATVFSIRGDLSGDREILFCTSFISENIISVVSTKVTDIVSIYNDDKSFLHGLFPDAKITEYGMNQPKADFAGLNIREREDCITFELLTNEGIFRVKLIDRNVDVSNVLGTCAVLSVIGKTNAEMAEILNKTN